MNILIVEDEKRIAKLLEMHIRELLGARLGKLHSCSFLGEANNYLEKHPVDLLFLDLNLNGENGFELLKKYTALSFQTVIVSAYKDQALKAFEYGVLDFVPKPFSRSRLEKTFNLFLKGRSTLSKGLKYIAVKKKGRILSIPISDIFFIKVDGHYSELHTADHIYLCNKSLDALEKLLPIQFIRTHRSYLVKLDQVKEILRFPGSKYQLMLKNGLTLPLSRKGYKLLEEKII